MSPIEIATVEAFAFRVPIENPLRTSFGIMRDRPAVLVRVVDADGAQGWGEVWCNFPISGAEHRARLVNEVVGPRLLGRGFADPPEAWRMLGRELEVLALQSGEIGPLAQALAGIDIALWDLVARRADLPLHRALGGEGGRASVPVYASGLNPDQPERMALARRAEGHRAFKLKIGFDRDLDLRNIATLRERLGAGDRLMVDSNQAYDLDTAIAMVRAVEPFALFWFEEPIRADVPLADWQTLAGRSPVPLAGGENLKGDGLDAAIASGALRVLQPDVAKWGGFSGILPVARRALAGGLLFCPHWLAGGVGLLASLHLLAAAGGDGLLEVDANPNPLRELLAGELPDVVDGRMAVPQTPGLGAVPDLAALTRYQTWPRRG